MVFRCRIETHSTEVVALKDIKYLEHDRTARTRRRHRDDLVTAICSTDRHAFLGDVILKIVQSDQAIVGLHVSRDKLGRLAGIEFAGSPTFYPFKRCGKLRLHKTVAFVKTLVAVQKD